MLKRWLGYCQVLNGKYLISKSLLQVSLMVYVTSNARNTRLLSNAAWTTYRECANLPRNSESNVLTWLFCFMLEMEFLESLLHAQLHWHIGMQILTWKASAWWKAVADFSTREPRNDVIGAIPVTIPNRGSMRPEAVLDQVLLLMDSEGFTSPHPRQVGISDQYIIDQKGKQSRRFWTDVRTNGSL